jgi:hypothetical protein
MSTIFGDIRFARGLEENLPSLEEGKPALTTDTKRVFVGSDEGNLEIARIIDVNLVGNEVSDARGGLPTLVERLNGVDTGKASVKKVNGFINIAEYDAVGDGVTSDQTAIVTAVTDAYTKGYTLFWGNDNKNYVSTDTIPNFHNVKHTGNAQITRGSNTFYISPANTETNNLYIGVSGSSNTFDGLTPDKPVAKIQTVFDYLAQWGPTLNGNWIINLATGTYTNAKLLDGLLTETAIQIIGTDVGGHPNVPTSIISDGVGASKVGLQASGGTKIIVKNVKFTGYNGTSSSAGIKVADASEVTTSNVHTDSCYWGVSGENRSEIVVPDGIHNNDGYLNAGGGTGAAFRSLQLNRHDIGVQNAGTQTSSAVIQNCYQAILAQESSTGHVDWCTVQDCVSGIVARVNARVNCDGTVFKRNTKDIQVDSNGHVYVSSAVVFSTGTDESTNKVNTSAGGNLTNNTIISGLEMAYSVMEKAIDMQRISQTVSTTTNTIVYSKTLKAPMWRGTPGSTTPMKKLYVRIYGTLNGTANTKSINLRLGSALVALQFAAAEIGTFRAEGRIYFTAADAQYLFLSGSRHLGTGERQSSVSGTNVMTSDQTLSVEGVVGTNTDSIVFELIEFGFAG